jgi:ubiquinone/menaquinone biosynthesis C-methylase UbiE
MQGYYAEIAPDYARHRRVHPEVFRQLVATAPIQASTRLLEAGCGTGNYICALSEAVSCPCWAVDPSEQMLAQARPRSSTVQFLRGQAEQLEFSSAFFDVVFSVDVVHHIGDRRRAFAEAWRVVRPGGRLCIVTDSEEILRTRQPQSKYFPETVAVELARYPSIPTLRGELAEAGFGQLTEAEVEYRTLLPDLKPYRAQVFSSLRLISKEAFARGMAELERDFQSGPVPWISRYLMLWATKPQHATQNAFAKAGDVP